MAGICILSPTRSGSTLDNSYCHKKKDAKMTSSGKARAAAASAEISDRDEAQPTVAAHSISSSNANSPEFDEHDLREIDACLEDLQGEFSANAVARAAAAVG